MRAKKNKFQIVCQGFLGLVILLTPNGCTVGPSYVPPCADIPIGWKTEQEEPDPQECIENWWDIFNDPILDELEQYAMENNKDLEIAIDRICIERAEAGIRKADLYPQVDLRSSYSNTAALIKVFGIPNVPGLPPSPTIIRVHELFYTLTFAMRYDLDLWGKFRNQYKAGLLKVEAFMYAYCSAMLAMTTDLAIQYFQMRAFDSQIEILEQTIVARREALQINKTRYEKSLVNYTDVSRAESLLYHAEAELFSVKRERAKRENMIALLIGVPAPELRLAFNPLVDEPPAIPAGIPSEILLKRPDILEAERMAASEHALINSAYGSLLPSISLTGEVGSSSPDLADFLSWQSRFWAFGANLTDSMFDGWRNLSRIDLAKAKFMKASAEYQKLVLEAFRDVENALSNISLQREEMAALEKAIESSEETTRLSKTRYFTGLVNYLEVVDSERSELDLERTNADLLGWRYASTVQLIKALGGGW